MSNSWSFKISRILFIQLLKSCDPYFEQSLKIKQRFLSKLFCTFPDYLLMYLVCTLNSSYYVLRAFHSSNMYTVSSCDVWALYNFMISLLKPLLNLFYKESHYNLYI